MHRSWLMVLWLLLASACEPKTPNKETERTGAKPPPPNDAPVPDSLRVETELDGKPGPVLDASKLRKTKPDYEKDGRRLWKMASLLGKGEGGRHQVEVEDARGVRTTFRAQSEGGEPMFMLSKRGESLVVIASPTAPFPEYHGKGERLERPGNPTRVLEPKKIRLVSGGGSAENAEAKGEPGKPSGQVEVQLDGKPQNAWNEATLARVPTRPVRAEGGEMRDAWSLRDLAKSLVDPNARVTAIVGEGGRKVELPEKRWKDAAWTPVVRANREGALKFQWVDRNGTVIREEELRNLEKIELARTP